MSPKTPSAKSVNALTHYRQNMTPEQKEEMRRKMVEGHRRRKEKLQQQQVDPNSRFISISINKRENRKYVPKSSRTLSLVNPPFEVDDLFEKLELFIRELKERGHQPRVGKHVRVVDFGQ